MGFDLVVLYCKDGKFSITDLASLQNAINHKNTLGGRLLAERTDGPGNYESFFDLKSNIKSLTLADETLTILHD